jgi:copper(I)-binding protein
MRMKLLPLVALLPMSAALAQVQVSDAWVRGTVQGQHATGAFMKLVAASDSTLVAAASPAAKVVEVHEMKMEGNVMKMRAVERLPLPAGVSVELKPSGYHLMMMSLQQTMNAGDAIPITLTFEDKSGKRTDVVVKAMVRPLTASGMPKH